MAGQGPRLSTKIVVDIAAPVPLSYVMIIYENLRDPVPGNALIAAPGGQTAEGGLIVRVWKQEGCTRIAPMQRVRDRR